MAATILVVEDDPALQETLVAILEFEGYAVLRARHGLEALERLRQRLPDLIVLDLMLPLLDGFGLAAELDREGLRGRVPILVLTADGHAGEKARRIGAEAYLAKPFDLGALVDMVARLVRH